MELFVATYAVVPLSAPLQPQEMSKVDPYPILNFQIPSLNGQAYLQIPAHYGIINAESENLGALA